MSETSEVSETIVPQPLRQIVLHPGTTVDFDHLREMGDEIQRGFGRVVVRAEARPPLSRDEIAGSIVLLALIILVSGAAGFALSLAVM